MDALFSAGIISLALQAGLIGLLIWIFARHEADVTFLKLMFASMGFTLIGLAIEIGFGPYLMEGTLAVHFLMLWLLVRKFFDIRPLRSAAVVLSFLLLAMGAVFLADRFESGRTSAMEETRARQADTVREALSESQILLQGFTGESIAGTDGEPDTEAKPALADASPGRTMLRLKDRILRLAGFETAAEPPEGTEAVTAASTPVPEPSPLPTPVVMVAATAIPRAIATEVETASLSGTDFESLFQTPDSDLAAAPSRPEDVPFMETSVGSQGPTIRIRDERSGEETALRDQRRGVTADELKGMVRIRNRSTDPRYEPPSFNITATGKGSRGSYVIANGQMIGQGSHMDNPGGEPRAWKLNQVSPTTIHWTPVP